ncbi:helix-turn-helix transcriptional regulator [Microbacterium soli]|uniref:HTH cro/C1-type domain-containing protein n=1 Tax=Microbacterium soli TaxID=446075 RepID=A0ABP7N8E9_9MICO
MPRVPSPAAAHIGALVAEARKQRGLTQDDLAHLARIDPSNVRSYEKGRAMMGIPTLIRLADALKVEPGSLLKGVVPELFAPRAVDERRRAG